jgi:ribosomal protein L30E
MITTEHIRKLIEEKKVTIGATATARALRADRLKTLVLASNAADQTRASLLTTAKLGGVGVEELSITNGALGTMCKKPFAIQALGIKK